MNSMVKVVILAGRSHLVTKWITDSKHIWRFYNYAKWLHSSSNLMPKNKCENHSLHEQKISGNPSYPFESGCDRNRPFEPTPILVSTWQRRKTMLSKKCKEHTDNFRSSCSVIEKPAASRVSIPADGCRAIDRISLNDRPVWNSFWKKDG